MLGLCKHDKIMKDMYHFSQIKGHEKTTIQPLVPKKTLTSVPVFNNLERNISNKSQ